MATTTAGLDVVNSKYYSSSVIDNNFLTNLLYAILWERRRTIAGGTDFLQPVILSSPLAVGSFTGNQFLNIPNDQNLYGAEYTFAEYYSGVQITSTEDWINMGPSATVNYLETKCLLADMALREFIGTDLQSDGTATDTNPNPVVGLKAAISASGVYANIDRAVWSNWQANVLSNSGTPRALTLPLMNTGAWNAARDNDRIDIYITTRGVMAKLTSLLQPAQQFVQPDPYIASIGFDNILYLNRPVIMDEHVQTSPVENIWGLNTRYLHLYVQEARAYRYIPFQMLPNQNAAISRTLVALQMVCDSPRAQLLITDINSAL